MLLVYNEYRTIGFALNDVKICKGRVKLRELLDKCNFKYVPLICIVCMLTGVQMVLFDTNWKIT